MYTSPEALQIRLERGVRAGVVDDGFPVGRERRPADVRAGVGRQVDEVRERLAADVEVHLGERVPVLVFVNERDLLAIRREGRRPPHLDDSVPTGRRDGGSGLRVEELRRRVARLPEVGRRHQERAVRVEAAVREVGIRGREEGRGVRLEVVARTRRQTSSRRRGSSRRRSRHGTRSRIRSSAASAAWRRAGSS